MSIQVFDLNRRRRLALLVVGLLAGIGFAIASNSGESQSQESATVRPAATPDARPVILLTGFEAFAGREQNGSWEGIRSLDGREFHGHRIVCREVPVEWGAPLEHLQEWNEELHPVAVFSFGEGGREGFDIETRASNQRGNVPDNNRRTPPSEQITSDGPDIFEATIDYPALHESLLAQGHPVRLSTNAGRFLCEECLYSLEYLRTSEASDADVMFCHVPPLGTELNGEEVTAEFVQEYVEDLLDAWYALAEGEESEAEETAAADSRRAEIEEFIQLYFRSWSDRDLRTYGACFLPGSCVQYVEGSRIRLYDLELFLDLQARVHRQSRVPLRETPESIDIRFEQDLARVVVYWKLVKGDDTEFGYDHFTLLKDSDDWRIINLIFYSVPAAAD